MKLSLLWIFDHIIGNWRQHNIEKLVELFNKTTAEIEAIEKIKINLKDFTLVRILAQKAEYTLCFSPEDGKEYTIPSRSDLKENDYALLWRKGADVRWAMLGDVGSSKEAFLPALNVNEKDVSGSWKNSIETEDYILHLDNKSVTHRPDLWGHRGVAREIAALLKLKLKSEDELLHRFPVKEYQQSASAISDFPFSMEVQDSKVCKRFGALFVSSLEYTPSTLFMALRLARVDSRPINALVDATNYVMLDIGQPMHAFDAAKLSSKKNFGPRHARAGEKLTLLDGQTITLTNDDLIISDGNPVALAGVMGGLSTAVTAQTSSLLVEAACFDAATIRKSALRHKHRTEASARFEKSLDPHNVSVALMRFMKLLDNADISYSASGSIVMIGAPQKKQTILVPHSFIESRIGMSIKPATITSILDALGFTVVIEKSDYTITVPSYRASKDEFLREDIVEEIARFNGYDLIPLELTPLARKPFSLATVLNERNIKQFMAFSMNAREVNNYALFDEEFLTTLAWQPATSVSVQNPISAMYTRLVTSLIPHLFKNLVVNGATQDRMRFFELNRIWSLRKGSVDEQSSLAALWYEKNSTINFYELKESISALFNLLNMDVSWKKPISEELSPWFDPYATAQIWYEDKVIGYVGLANPQWVERTLNGSVGIVELNAARLIAKKSDMKKFTPLPKYPSTSFDISVLVPLLVTVEQIAQKIEHADGRIYSVELIDSFEKAEWKDKKSLTFRIFARDPEKTLIKEEIDHIHNHVLLEVTSLGAQIR